MLRTYRTYNSIVRFSKYESNNKILGDVILLRVIQDVIYINIYIYIYIKTPHLGKKLRPLLAIEYIVYLSNNIDK